MVFHRLKLVTLVILYIKCNQLVEKGISWYVQMLTYICQSRASRLHLFSVGSERPFQQAGHLKSSSSLNSSSNKCVSPAGIERELWLSLWKISNPYWHSSHAELGNTKSHANRTSCLSWHFLVCSFVVPGLCCRCITLGRLRRVPSYSASHVHVPGCLLDM